MKTEFIVILLAGLVAAGIIVRTMKPTVLYGDKSSPGSNITSNQWQEVVNYMAANEKWKGDAATIINRLQGDFHVTQGQWDTVSNYMKDNDKWKGDATTVINKHIDIFKQLSERK